MAPSSVRPIPQRFLLIQLKPSHVFRRGARDARGGVFRHTASKEKESLEERDGIRGKGKEGGRKSRP